MLIRDELKTIIDAGIDAAIKDGKLPHIDDYGMLVVIEKPKLKEHGDLACGVALKLAAPAKMPPLKIAEFIADYARHHIDGAGGAITNLTVAQPGFMNFELGKKWLCRALHIIHQQAESFGRLNIGSGIRVLVEYVSTNPTGELHIGHGRNAIFGNCLAKLLRFAGYEVEEEFYINDVGEQIAQLGACAWALYKKRLGHAADYPESGYPENSLIEFVDAIIAVHNNAFMQLSDQAGKIKLAELTKNTVLAGHKELLEKLGVRFNTWFSEKTLHDSQAVQEALAKLTENGFTYEAEGALWLKAKELGDERDRVLRKTSGATTYLANDAAYHLDKFKRGFTLLINIWGADHHGQIPGIKAVIKALGKDEQQLEVLLTQIVNLSRDGKIVRMSKRRGTVVSLQEVIDEVGVDAVRYFLAESSPLNPMNFDLELAKKTSRENPAFYIQYAHARCCAILRRALEPVHDTESGKTEPPTLNAEQWRQYLKDFKESEDVFSPAFDDDKKLFADQKALVMLLAAMPAEIQEAVTVRQPGRIARYAFEVANELQKFYETSRVIVPDAAVTKARLGLIAATKQVLANALGLIGVSAPERM